MSVTLNASTSSGLVQTADTSGTIELQSNGTTKLTVSSSGVNIGQMNGGTITSGTAVASTSGTSIDFTSIPSWVKRITLMFAGVSTSGTNFPLLQLGNGSIVNTGYVGSRGTMQNASTTGITSVTDGFGIASNTAGYLIHGSCRFELITGNTWVATGSFISTGSNLTFLPTGGYIVLGSTLDRLRITTVGGTDTFDAGTINILYEG